MREGHGVSALPMTSKAGLWRWLWEGGGFIIVIVCLYLPVIVSLVVMGVVEAGREAQEQAALQAPPGVRVFRDPGTGCEYLVAPGLLSSTMEPRRDASGAHRGCAAMRGRP